MPADSDAKKSASSLQKDKPKDGPVKSTAINLSGKPKESNSTLFYKWTIQIGRIVIVLTELVALSALGYRFIIDRQIADLNDQIDRQILFIQSQEQKEQEFRGLQNKLSIIKTIKKDTDAKINVMNTVLDAANEGIFTTDNIAVNKNIISLSGATSSVFSLNGFIENLKTNEFVKAISIAEITSGDTGILFKLNITLADSPAEMEGEVVTQ
ncbi:MAG TPA: hypothetical protein PLD54_03950 [Candidatus Levybacteria bacterium]|nr:hypothetical protein [Candidatus Levybacteria bacterium]